MGLETMLGLSIFAGLASTGINAAVQSSQNSKNLAAQKDLMKYQDELNASRWNDQFNTLNEYNAPKQEIQRLEEAGINPLYNSNFSGSSAASIGANTGLGSYAGSMPNMDLQSVIAPLISSFFNEKSLALEDRKVKALEEKTGAEIRNDTNMTNSDIAVNAKKILSMEAETKKTDEEITQIKESVQAMKESVRQNWTKIYLESNKTAQGWADLAIKDFTSQWQKKIGERNASTGWFEAETRRKQYELSDKMFNFEKEKFNKQYDLDVAKFSKDLRDGNIDAFMKVCDLASANLFGFKYTSPKDIQQAMAVTAAFVNNMNDMSDEQFCKIAPNVTNIMDALTKVRVKKQYKTYITPIMDAMPADVSDGF